jgi:hypothetical protein
MNLIVKSPVWDDLREIGLRIASEVGIDEMSASDRFSAHPRPETRPRAQPLQSGAP